MPVETYQKSSCHLKRLLEDLEYARQLRDRTPFGFASPSSRVGHTAVVATLACIRDELDYLGGLASAW